MADSVRCPKCGAPLSESNAVALAPCPKCATPVQFWIFPAQFKTTVADRAAENLIIGGESSCFYHPSKQAAVPCDACGRFLCSLCDCEIQGRHFCPGCVTAGRTKGRIASLERRRTVYDSLALTLAVVGFFTGPGALVCGPAAVFVAVRYWNKSSSIIPRTKARSVIAILLGLALTALWSYLIYQMFTDGDL